MKVRKAVIPVAGLGTRFLPVTKVVAKELLPVVDRPTIHYIVEEAALSGIEQVIFVTASGKSGIEDYFDRALALEAHLESKGECKRAEMIRDLSKMVEVHSVRQKIALGLGHAVGCAKHLIGDEPFAVLLGDDMMDAKVPATRQLIKAFERCGGAVVGVFKVPMDQTHKYGIVKLTAKITGTPHLHRVKCMVEKPAADPPSDLAISGHYIFPPEIFECIEKTKPGKGGEIQLTDAMNIFNKGRRRIFALEMQGRRYDAGTILGFIEANIAYALKRDDLATPIKKILKAYLDG